ncbi:MAG: hypothetical protein KA802_18015 [Saprospiraceae bacterium]|nr:hypothetical protein [Saprospiraceae bacterium]
MLKILKFPSAWLPIVMSIGALTVPYLLVILVGPDNTGDEGIAARTFQLLMVGQLPIILYFAIRWLPQKRKQALQILVIQFFLGMLAFAPVYFFKL